MAKSMTGFGAAQVGDERYRVETEVRSLNNRYLKVRIHAPGAISILEAEIENFIRTKLSRGAVDVWLKLTDVSPADAYQLDMEVARRYMDFAAKLGSEAGVSGKLEARDYLMLPGVVGSVGQNSDVADLARPVVLRAVDSALSSLESMRRREGKALAQDIRARAGIIRNIAGTIAERAPAVVRLYRDRLVARVRELVAGTGVELAEADLLKEISIFAERSDISEEIARIESHVAQLEEALDSDSDIGRKLEFVAQELHREVNTIGSKANDAAISRLVVDAKGEVDRIREQAANLE